MKGEWRGFTSGPRQPPPAHGVQVGAIGATWWGQRWIEALERISTEYAGRLTRGRTYARAGRVHDLAIAGGEVTALVTGSRPRPYEVRVSIAPLGAPAWDRAIAAMSEQVLFTAELLADRMPARIDDAFRASDASLFPSGRGDLTTACSCPDWANPCKHVAATHYVLGEAFDKDPFLLFELRGRGRDAVLGALRALRVGGESAAGPARPATVSLARRDPADLERAAAPLGGLRLDFDPSPDGGALARLGAPPSWRLEGAPADLVGWAYRRAAERARALALSTGAGEEVDPDDAGDEPAAPTVPATPADGRAAPTGRRRSRRP